MPAEKFVVAGDVPGQDFCRGQVISIAKGKDKLLALKAIRPLRKGVDQHGCECGSQFDSASALKAHQERKHPAPPPPPPPPAPKQKKEEPKAAPVQEAAAAESVAVVDPAAGGEEKNEDEKAE